MVYDHWQTVMQEFGGQIALTDLGANQSWTFRELDTEARAWPQGKEAVLFPTGNSVGFIISVLCAWRHDRVVCPQEINDPPPSLTELPSSCRLIKTTSATTGAPRCVLFNQNQMVADADQIVRTMGLRREWPNLGFISLAHSYGFSNLVLPLLLYGIPLVLATGTLPESLRRAAMTGSDWTIAAVPALWRVWHQAGAIPANIRLAISAGAPLPLPLEEAVHESTGLKIHNFLGSTECGGIAYDRSEAPRTDATLAGTPMDGVMIDQGMDGCLEVRSAAVGMTYWPDPDERLMGGCFRTCDLVELRGGQVFIEGRANDRINIAGRKVSPESIERVLLSHPEVSDCLVLGMPAADASRGEIVVALIVARQAATIEILKAFLLEYLPAWQMPKHWHLLESLGTNRRGKLSRAEWRHRLLSQILRASE